MEKKTTRENKKYKPGPFAPSVWPLFPSIASLVACSSLKDKALAEKTQHDLQSQNEQEEKHRLAETLDYDIKRWATGKEGNLRALLSSLQHVPDTTIIFCAKSFYRIASLMFALAFASLEHSLDCLYFICDVIWLVESVISELLL
ncbi:hypothetical protein RND71_009941 [Anisodus tanguticus]|uniref:Uncharacterized protein n=1 Tax=Anisodus tanguticus TaxID=243964 RepID=A0AAE1VND1_9SOLA|nr:hypothetical protein RND71_009941 [Anisodus tanguticus]